MNTGMIVGLDYSVIQLLAGKIMVNKTSKNNALIGLVGWFLAFLPDALAKEYPHAYVKVCS